jgi:hypothetical protein
VHQFTLQHAAKIKSEKYRKKIRNLIKTGGLESEINEDEFIGLQLFLGVAFPIFLYIMNFSLDLGLSTPLVIGLGFFGFFMPQMHCKGTKKNRELSVRADMPFFIDLLALSVEAGLDFFGAIQKIVDKVAAKDSVLAEEFKIVLKDIKIGSSKTDRLKCLSTSPQVYLIRLEHPPETTRFPSRDTRCLACDHPHPHALCSISPSAPDNDPATAPAEPESSRTPSARPAPPARIPQGPSRSA